MSAPAYRIRPTFLRVKNFRGWLGEHEIPLGPELTLLIGDNASGKSSTLNAIEWCLFGGEIAKKGSGIDERAGWEIRNRGTRDEVRVNLTLDVEGGEAVMSRSRASDARARDSSHLQLERPDDDLLENDEVVDWLKWNRLPDWATWKQAFCQHQELLRVRVSDTGERSIQLGRLLGLEEYQEFNASLKDLKFKNLEKAATEELDDLQDELRRALERPGNELREIEDQLQARGVARTDIGETLIRERIHSLLSKTLEVVKLAGIDAIVPDPASSSPEETLQWTAGWERQVQARNREVEREAGQLRGRIQELESILQGLEPARRRVDDARNAIRNFTTERGDETALQAQADDLERERRALEDELKERDALCALLRQALEQLRRSASRDHCPVCEQTSSDLEADLMRRIEASGMDDIAQRLAEITARITRVKELLVDLSKLESELRAAEAEYEHLARRLRDWLPEGTTDLDRAAHDLLSSMTKKLDALEEQIRQIDKHLVEFRAEREVLEMLNRWMIWRKRADDAASGLDGMPAWDELQQVLDEAAGLACDLEMLGSLAREAQKQRSTERVEAVNAGLGRHYGRITGDSSATEVRVEVKATATRLSYRLVDGSGEDITPILNQAALNALSFALLFAQAEDRARAGLPAWVVLDDPGQNFDEANVSGLAEAVLALSAHCPVLLATYPGELEQALLKRASDSASVFRLARDGAGSRIEEVRS